MEEKWWHSRETDRAAADDSGSDVNDEPLRPPPDKDFEKDAEKMSAKENWGIWPEQYAANYSQQLEEKDSSEWEEYVAFEYGIIIIGAILFFVVFTFVVLFATL